MYLCCMAKTPKRPRDTNQLAKFVVDLGTSEKVEEDIYKGKNPAAVALGKLGGLKGGPARAAKLSAERRTEIARNAVNSRWRKKS